MNHYDVMELEKIDEGYYQVVSDKRYITEEELHKPYPFLKNIVCNFGDLEVRSLNLVNTATD